MQYDIDGGNITVIVGEEARIDVPTALNYIKSGQAEIGETVDAGIDAFDLNAANKTTAYDNNASAKLAAYNDNATDKLNAFNLNASGKTTDFNDNYTLKKAAVDASADAAAASATLAQQWAIKMDGKVADEDYSAKYYADLAAQSAGATGANIDLSNLSPTGEAKFDAKQDVIDADHKLSYDYLSDTPDLSAYVTKDTAQTITGNKTFAGEAVKQLNSLSYGGFKVQNTQLEKGTTPSSNTGGQFNFQDKDGLDLAHRIGGIESVYGTDGNIVTRLLACEPVADSTNYASVDVVYKSDGTTYATAPTPGASLNLYSTTIPTIGWVNTAGDSANNILHKTGTETITGAKTFTQAIDTVRSNMTKGTAPESNTYNVMLWGLDVNSKAMGMVELGYLTDKQTKMTIGAFNGNTTDSADNGVYLELFNDNGTGYAKCPASDVNGSIVTTVNKSKAANGYFKLSNGLIIQWGSFTYASGSGSVTVTLPQAMSSGSSYKVAVSFAVGRAHTGAVSSQTSTSFNFQSSSFESSGTANYIAIGY